MFPCTVLCITTTVLRCLFFSIFLTAFCAAQVAQPAEKVEPGEHQHEHGQGEHHHLHLVLGEEKCAPTYTYDDGPLGPSHWPEVCNTGKMQAPIGIEHAASESERARYVQATLFLPTDWIADCRHTNRRLGPADDLCRQAADRADPPATTRGRGFDSTPVTSEGDGWGHAYAESTFMVCRARPSAECGDPGRIDCRALHSLRGTSPLALDDGHPKYLSGVPCLGTIRGSARRCGVALLREASGGASRICGRVLK